MRDKVISFRMTSSDYKEMKEAMTNMKLKNFSSFVLYLWDSFKREMRK